MKHESTPNRNLGAVEHPGHIAFTAPTGFLEPTQKAIRGGFALRINAESGGDGSDEEPSADIRVPVPKARGDARIPFS
jgi:hypothetical protein